LATPLEILPQAVFLTGCYQHKFRIGDATNISNGVNSGKSVRSRGGKRILGWILKALALVAILWLVFILTGRALRHIAIAQIAELTNTKIKARSVDFNLDGSVFIEKLVVRPHKKQQYDDAILKAETVYARFGIASLLLLRPRLKEISVNDFVFDAQYDLDTDRWNIPALKVKTSKSGSGKMPSVHLEKGTLQYSKVSNGQVKVISAVPVEAGFRPTEKTRDSYSFNITTAEGTRFGKNVLIGAWQPGRITIAGGVSLADVPVFERAWAINVLASELNYDQTNAYSLRLIIKDLVSTHSSVADKLALDKLPFLQKFRALAALQSFFDTYQPLGQLDIDLEASGNLKQLSKSTVKGKLYCRDVSICHRKFPYPMENLVGPIDFTENNMLFKNLHGRHKDVDLTINGSFDDFGPNLKGLLQITSTNMALDNDLYDALDPNQKQLWTDFSPSGLVAINYTLSQEPQTSETYALNVELLDVEGKYVEFPYPLKNLTGHLFFDQNSIDVRNFVSQVDDRRIVATGKITATDTNEPDFDILIKVANIPLDATLAAALYPPQRRLYDQLKPKGLGYGQIKVFSQPHTEPRGTFIADLNFKNASLNIEEPPFPISDITAKAVFTPDMIDIENLVGQYSNGLFSLTGQIWPAVEAQQHRYHLSLHGEKTDLNDDLIGMLPAPMNSIIPKLEPKGKINFIADLEKNEKQSYPDYKVVVDCLGNSIGARFAKELKQTHEKFGWFSYPLKDVTGSLTITKNSVTLADITATAADNVQITPNASTIKINGEIALADDAFSSASITIGANDVLLDERLRIALPEDMQSFYARLSPTGRFDLDFENTRIFKDPNGEKYIDLAGVVKFKDSNFNISPGITDADAALRIKSLYKTGDWFCNAQAAIIADRLKIKGISLTDLKADVDYDRRQKNLSTENLIADCYGGKLAAKLQLKRPTDKTPEYLLQMAFDNIDLKQFLSDVEPKKTSENSRTTGRMCGSLSVIRQNTDSPESHQRIGRCRLRITDMQVGKPSLLGKLLSVLKLTEPKHFAFDRMLVDSYIRNNTVFLEQLDLSGEAIAFNGSGLIDLQRQKLDLTLFARGRRLPTAEPSILQSLTEGLGLGIVRMDIIGDLYDPQVTTTALPVFKGPLGILGTKPNSKD